MILKKKIILLCTLIFINSIMFFALVNLIIFNKSLDEDIHNIYTQISNLELDIENLENEYEYLEIKSNIYYNELKRIEEIISESGGI